jgi:hypothetical protein
MASSVPAGIMTDLNEKFRNVELLKEIAINETPVDITSADLEQLDFRYLFITTNELKCFYATPLSLMHRKLMFRVYQTKRGLCRLSTQI